MFGLFGESKYVNVVYSKVRFFIGQAGVEKTNDTFTKIKNEIVLNRGEHWDENLTFHDFVAEQIDLVVWERREYLRKNVGFSENQAAIYFISEYINNLGERGVLKNIMLDQKDMFQALQKLWEFCLRIGSDAGTSKNYSHVLASSKTFEELVG